jgi:Domain of unknown function (DUF2703)
MPLTWGVVCAARCVPSGHRRRISYKPTARPRSSPAHAAPSGDAILLRWRRPTPAGAPSGPAAAKPVTAAAGVGVGAARSSMWCVHRGPGSSLLVNPTRGSQHDCSHHHGVHITGELVESACDACSESCACNGGVDCRDWVWQGQRSQEPPLGLIVEAIMRHAGGGEPSTTTSQPRSSTVPANLRQYFAAASADTPAVDCCSVEEQVGCCDPAVKTACCGNAPLRSTCWRCRRRRTRPRPGRPAGLPGGLIRSVLIRPRRLIGAGDVWMIEALRLDQSGRATAGAAVGLVHVWLT